MLTNHLSHSLGNQVLGNRQDQCHLGHGRHREGRRARMLIQMNRCHQWVEIHHSLLGDQQCLDQAS